MIPVVSDYFELHHPMQFRFVVLEVLRFQSLLASSLLPVPVVASNLQLRIISVMCHCFELYHPMEFVAVFLVLLGNRVVVASSFLIFVYATCLFLFHSLTISLHSSGLSPVDQRKQMKKLGHR